MPIMDGLTLIEKTSATHPDIKFIFLSNFSDFHMVKKAFQFGASDYILKADFSQDTFLKVLSEVIKKMNPVFEKPASNYARREHVLKEYFWGGIIAKSEPECLRVNVHVALVVAVIKLLNYDEILSAQWNSERENMKFGLYNVIDEILESCGNGEFFFNSYDEIIFVFSSSDSGTLNLDCNQLFDSIISVFNMHFNLNALAAIYDTGELCAIKEQYSKLRDSLGYSLILGTNVLISARDVMSFEDTFDIRSYASRSKVLVKSFEFKTLCGELGNISGIRPAIRYISDVRKFYTSLISVIREVFEEYTIDTSGQRLFDISSENCTVDEMNELIASATQYFVSQLASSDIVVMQIQNYVYENYTDNITLQSLAEKFSYDYAGLSRRFQKVAGMSFPNFLNEIRLNEAMKLIKITDYKISGIATMVGYNNYESFSRNFKKKFKKWPNEIRKEEKHEKEGF